MRALRWKTLNVIIDRGRGGGGGLQNAIYRSCVRSHRGRWLSIQKFRGADGKSNGMTDSVLPWHAYDLTHSALFSSVEWCEWCVNVFMCKRFWYTCIMRWSLLFLEEIVAKCGFLVCLDAFRTIVIRVVAFYLKTVQFRRKSKKGSDGVPTALIIEATRLCLLLKRACLWEESFWYLGCWRSAIWCPGCVVIERGRRSRYHLQSNAHRMLPQLIEDTVHDDLGCIHNTLTDDNRFIHEHWCFSKGDHECIMPDWHDMFT